MGSTTAFNQTGPLPFGNPELLSLVKRYWRKQELIRRWDSERELFYDDIVHV